MDLTTPSKKLGAKKGSKTKTDLMMSLSLRENESKKKKKTITTIKVTDIKEIKPNTIKIKRTKTNKEDSSIKLEEVKKTSQKLKRFDSEPDDNFNSPINVDSLVKSNINQHELIIDCFEQN